MKKRNLSVFTILMAGLLMAGVAFCPSEKVQATPVLSENWIGTWTTSPQQFGENGISYDGFKNTSLRMIIHPNISGSSARIRLSNIFGIKPVTFNSVHIAQQDIGAAIIPGTDKTVTFNSGQSAVTVWPGTEILSDSIAMKVEDKHNLTVSIFIAGASGPTTWHKQAMQTNYISNPGDHTRDIKASDYTKTVTSWFWLTGVEVVPDETVKGTLVVLGDSITNGECYGNCSIIDLNRRYSDYLAERIRLESPQYQLAVLNQGIGANRLITDTSNSSIKVLDRLERDVLQQNKLKVVILLIGINDIGNRNFDSDQIIAGMKKVIQRVHEKGARIYGGTLTPFAVYTNKPGYYTPEGEKTRETINNWIRNSGVFDGVIDFDQVIRDPKNPLMMLPKYDCGDHLHPNDAGYEAMANAIDLRILKGQ
jgi:lysophospholipase L1-like esterase